MTGDSPKTYESEPEPGSDDKSELFRADSCRVEVYRAALRGDWKAAETALNWDRSAGCLEITEREDRPLHIAAATKRTVFVRNLVENLNTSDLALQNKHGNTAFCNAAVSGVVEIAKVMYEKNKELPTIRGGGQMTPFEMAVLLGNKKMVEYLYKITPLGDFEAKERMRILVATIHTDMYDIALKILNTDPSIVTPPPPTEKKGIDPQVLLALQALAQKHLSHDYGYGTSQERFWERLVSIIATVPYVPCFKRIYCSLQERRQAGQLVKRLWELILTLPDKDFLKIIEETRILTDAAKIGNVEFLTLLTQSYPDLIWKINSDKYSIFHIAVIYRQERVFSLIYDTGAIKDLMMLYKDNKNVMMRHYKDKKGNNILHLAAKLAPPSRLNIVSGAALQMQREILWFKEVEKIVLPSDIKMKNKEGKTPRELFSDEHNKLREAGEEWMKDTATSCMVVAALIATVAFAAAFTVPEDDFLFTLPAKLMFGLVSLFASIVFMVVTFSATFFVVYKEETLPGLVAALALLTITLYAVLNSRLSIALIRSACWSSRFMFRPGKHRLF
ncbi:Ankyrin repeat family protein [Abeliophyllum distichum]|uniref:Ankyrin repeat family protein n=1 Tax=Abeliophyllum distichum TaxID=126358 RepID=A0ABD1UJ85_9LAMI